MKSTAHISFSRFGASNDWRNLFGSRRFVRLGKFSYSAQYTL
jgi:hypothetical protein